MAAWWSLPQDIRSKGTGIDIDPQRIQEANANAKKEGVENMVRFLNQDLFEADIHDATVVTRYLLPGINLKLKPKLWKDLKPGTRIVSHSFDMGDWQPEKKEDMDGRMIYSGPFRERPNENQFGRVTSTTTGMVVIAPGRPRPIARICVSWRPGGSAASGWTVIS